MTKCDGVSLFVDSTSLGTAWPGPENHQKSASWRSGVGPHPTSQPVSLYELSTKEDNR